MYSPTHSVPLHTLAKTVPEDRHGTFFKVAETRFTAAANAGTRA
jgi:hypothetical protein